MELLCAVKNYEWGQLGYNSLVAKLAEKNDPEFTVEDETPYAEFWMGTHINGPSVVKSGKKPLKEYIDENPSCLGSPSTLGTDLPFLFKVLSVRKALSIQVHPNKEDACKLREKFPKLYTDENHKPELAVALTDFEALCGFRPLGEISDFMQKVPELCHLIDGEQRHRFIEHPTITLLQKCFSSYISVSPVTARKCAAQLIERLTDSDPNIKKSQLADLTIRLNRQFPGDIGIFAVYFLNYLILKPGEAIFLGAGVPHAYIFGDCVEIMARSDNVVRAGLTPKTRDVATLLEIIEYLPRPAEDVLFKGRSFHKYIHIFKPAVPDFALSRICVPAKETFTLPVLKRASIILVIKGSADCELHKLYPGVVTFISSGCTVTFTVQEDLEMYQAYPNL